MKYEKGDSIQFSCSSCRKLLCELIVTKPEMNSTYKYLATCPYCGDKSFVKEITGGIVMGGVGEFDETSPTCDDRKTYTIIDRIEYKDPVVIHIIKAQK